MAWNFRKVNMKTAVVVALCVVLTVCTVGGVWAYLTAKTNTLTNTFEPAKVTCSIEETFSNGIKKNVAVRNTGNVDAYIRAYAVATFQSGDGKVLATAPVEGVDYTVTWTNNGWNKGTDGFWYYSSAVAPNALTPNLIDTATVISTPDGYSLNIQIIATAIQSNPENAVFESWGITPTNGKLFPN